MVDPYALGKTRDMSRGVAPNCGPWVQTILLGPRNKYHSDMVGYYHKNT